MVLLRAISFLIHTYSTEDSSSKIIFLEKPWYLIYSSYKIDPSENYNWVKIRSDIDKGVDPLLAVQREAVIFLEIEMFNLSNNHKNLLITKHDGKVHITKYETMLEEELILLEFLEAQNTLKETAELLGEETFQEIVDYYNKGYKNEN